MHFRFGSVALRWMAAMSLVTLIAVSGCHHDSNGSSVAMGNGTTAGQASGSTGQTPSASTGTAGQSGTTGDTAGSGGPDATTGSNPSLIKPPVKRSPLPDMSISNKGTNGWGKSDFTADQLAVMADKAQANLTDAAFEANAIMNISQGRGMTVVKGAISGPHKFNVDYETWDKDHPGLVKVIANGAERYTNRDLKLGIGSKLAKRSALKPLAMESGSAYLKNWLTNMPAYVTGYYRYLNPTYQPLIKAIEDRSSGFTLTAEKRVTPYQGTLVTDYRILAVRDQNSAKGYAEIEIVLDGQKFLPVTVRSRYRFPNEKPNELKWEGKWYPKNNPASAFVLPGVVGKP